MEQSCSLSLTSTRNQIRIPSSPPATFFENKTLNWHASTVLRSIQHSPIVSALRYRATPSRVRSNEKQG